jgi:hypothetical protein
MTEILFVALFIAGLALLGATALARPRSLPRYESIPRAFGLGVGARLLMTRAAGAALLAVSLALCVGCIRSLS